MHYILVILENRVEINKEVELKQQEEGIIHVGKVIRILNLVKHITMVTKNISSNKVIICIDNKKILPEYN